jgi:hypothetical protein
MGNTYTTHMVNRSPIYLLLCVIIVIIGAIGQILPIRQLIWLFVLGAGLSPIVIMLYITERTFYAVLYGVSYGLISTWIIHSSHFFRADAALTYFLIPANVLGGTFAVFFSLRKKLLKIV